MNDEYIDEEEIKTIEYGDLSDSLKDDVRDHFRNDEYLVPDDWTEWIIEGIHERYSQIEIDESSITYDMYRNDFGWKGNIDFEHPDIKKLIPKSYFEYEDNEWLYEVSDSFEDDEMEGNYTVDENLIYQTVEEDIFEDTFSFTEGKAEISTSGHKQKFTKALETYKEYDLDASNKIKEWLGLIEASELFFQDTITIEGDDYDSVVSDIPGDIINEIENFMERGFFEKLNEFISDVFDEFSESLIDSYDYYHTDEYADESLLEKTFEVVVDGDGNQKEILDLNGTW